MVSFLTPKKLKVETQIIDAHLHANMIFNKSSFFVNELDGYVTLPVPLAFEDSYSGQFPDMHNQVKIAAENKRLYPHANWVAGIDTAGISEDDWYDKTVEIIQSCVNKGALGAKWWKRTGLSDTDEKGELITLEHQTVQKLLHFFEDSGLILYWHYADPSWLWKPLDQMVAMPQHHKWCTAHPEDHMYGKSPDFDSLLNILENTLVKFPRLRVCGAHLWNIGDDLDRLNRLLTKCPNSVVDLAERVIELIHIARVGQRVKLTDFIIKYVDRIHYGSDIFINHKVDGGEETHKQRFLEQISSEWSFFATTETITHPKYPTPVQGLGLDRKIVDKIFYQNARDWLVVK